ncbi:Retrovirus-related Pol polyprotein from transposon TNT 1-94, partial [Pseudolycoriella hygida]
SRNTPANVSSNPNGSAKFVRHTAFTVAFIAKNEKNKNEWFLDSAASSNMTPFGDIVNKKVQCSIKHIATANDSKMKVNCVGSVNLNISDNHIEAKEVLHVPELSVNLLSVSKLVKSGNTVVFDMDGCRIYNSFNELVTKCKETSGVYKIRTDDPKCMYTKVCGNKLVQWHRLLGHLNYQSMLKMRDGAVNGIKFGNDSDLLKSCEICPMGKQARLPFPISNNRAKNFLDLIHADVCGDMEDKTGDGAKDKSTVSSFNSDDFVNDIQLNDTVDDEPNESIINISSSSEESDVTFSEADDTMRDPDYVSSFDDPGDLSCFTSRGVKLTDTTGLFSYCPSYIYFGNASKVFCITPFAQLVVFGSLKHRCNDKAFIFIKERNISEVPSFL